MSEADTIKAGWSKGRLLGLWFGFFAFHVVRVRLRNSGKQAIGYDTCDQGTTVPRYWCRIKRDGAWADIFPSWLNAGKAILGVGEQLDFSVWLPPDVTAWELAFGCDRPGPKEWAAVRLYKGGSRKWLPRVLLKAIPHGESAGAELRSDTFAVESNAVAGQTRQFRSNL